MIHNENKIVLSTISVIFLVSILVVAIQHFIKISFGFLGFIAWIVVILGAIYFVLWVLSEIFG